MEPFFQEMRKIVKSGFGCFVSELPKWLLCILCLNKYQVIEVKKICREWPIYIIFWGLINLTFDILMDAYEEKNVGHVPRWHEQFDLDTIYVFTSKVDQVFAQ